MDASADLLKVNHRLESRVPEIGLLGSEGGATSSVVPTPISRWRAALTTPRIFPSNLLEDLEQHPVVHVAYEDAETYAKWAGKDLPTEAEWEYAARGGIDGAKFTWGNEHFPDGKAMANTWQGEFPWRNLLLDGHEGTAPVGSFPANGYGLHDMAGNAWEWCADWYQPKYYRESPEKNPKGPLSGYDPLEPNTPKRVQRGGSFLCADNYCVRYVMGARG